MACYQQWRLASRLGFCWFHAITSFRDFGNPEYD
jgi:hypothetical protein